MKHSKLYTYLGITGALLVPALAVAAIEIPNVFEGGNPVSASEMNQNFETIADAIEELEAKVEKLEAAGLQAPTELDHPIGPLTDLRNVYRTHTDGILSARSMGENVSGVTVRFDLGPSEGGILDCDGTDCIPSLGRGYDGGSGAVFVPANHYVSVEIDVLAEGGNAGIFWQPLHGPDPAGKGPTLIESTHP